MRQLDIGHDEVRPQPQRQPNRLPRVTGEAADIVAEVRQQPLEIHRDEEIVFDNKYPEVFLASQTRAPLHVARFVNGPGARRFGRGHCI